MGKNFNGESFRANGDRLMKVDFQGQLESAFPSNGDEELTRGMREGILLADDLTENTPLLATAIGKDLLGHVRRAAIMFRIYDLCNRGDLPFSAKIQPMPHGRWHWLEIESGAFKAYICRSDGPREFPIDTLSRQDSRLVNQLSLFAPSVISLQSAPEMCAWLTYSVLDKGVLGHLCWGMPPADDGDWIAHIDVLRRLRDRKKVFASEPEKPSKRLSLKFKAHIEETLERQNGRQGDKKKK
jgi:hypothetical protein